MSKKDIWFDPKYKINRKGKSVSSSKLFKKEREKLKDNGISKANTDQSKSPSITKNPQKNNNSRIYILENALEEIIFEETGLNLLKKEITSLKEEGCKDVSIRKLKEQIFTQRLAILKKIVNVVKYCDQKFPANPLESKEIKKLTVELEEKNDLLIEWAHRVQMIWNKAFRQGDKLDRESIDIETC